MSKWGSSQHVQLSTMWSSSTIPQSLQTYCLPMTMKTLAIALASLQQNFLNELRRSTPILYMMWLCRICGKDIKMRLGLRDYEPYICWMYLYHFSLANDHCDRIILGMKMKTKYWTVTMLQSSSCLIIIIVLNDLVIYNIIHLLQLLFYPGPTERLCLECHICIGGLNVKLEVIDHGNEELIMQPLPVLFLKGIHGHCNTFRTACTSTSHFPSTLFLCPKRVFDGSIEVMELITCG